MTDSSETDPKEVSAAPEEAQPADQGSSTPSGEVTDSDQELEDLDHLKPIEEPTEPPKKKKIFTYGDRCRNYWREYANPYVWTSMPICAVIGIGFWAFHYIPNYSKCMLAQSIFAIIGGVLVGAIPHVQGFVHHAKVYPGVAFSKQQFMRLAVILYGFKVKMEDIGEVGAGGAIASIIMVIITFVLGVGIGRLMKIPLTQSGVISTGFSICGIAAILSSSGIFQSSSAETSLAAVFVIVGGFIDIIIYPSLYSIRDKLGWNDKSFGVAAGISIKEIAHTVSVGLSCSPEVSKFAMIVKMFKVLLLPFLLIALAFIIPPIQKCNEDRRQKRERMKKMEQGLEIEEDEEKEKKTVGQKCNEFWGKVSIPYFALIFILMSIINSYVYVSEKAHEVLSEIVQASLCASMFCVGITTDLRQLARASNWRPFVMFALMYIWVFAFGWFLEHFLLNI